jgi:hypothetical protein
VSSAPAQVDEATVYFAMRKSKRDSATAPTDWRIEVSRALLGDYARLIALAN